jgi:hypothetical protein
MKSPELLPLCCLSLLLHLRKLSVICCHQFPSGLQLVIPYPPFGFATISVLNIAAYLMLIGIYSSATLVSANTNLRKTIYKHALESKLLNLIGHAEFERDTKNCGKNY